MVVIVGIVVVSIYVALVTAILFNFAVIVCVGISRDCGGGCGD